MVDGVALASEVEVTPLALDAAPAVVTDAPSIKFLIRLYRDKQFLKDTVRSWGWMAPLVFIIIQALQVVS